jgi:hypothetical protein
MWFLPFIQPILNFFGGPVIKGLADSYKAKLDAGNTSERIGADLAARELIVEQRERELATQIVLAEQGNWFTRCVRPLWAAPFVIWTWKAVVVDKVFGPWLGYAGLSTDPLDGQLGTLCTTVAGAYFIGRSAETITRILKSTKQ